MEVFSVVLAAVAAFVVGALWYTVFAQAWIDSSGVPLGADGKPVNAGDPMTYVRAVLFTILVAGMMRHAFVLGGIDTAAKGLVSGLGIGLFMITPWMGIHYSFSAKPMKLLAIDGGYAALGCSVMGLVLTLA
jgi:hypothetical protein